MKSRQILFVMIIICMLLSVSAGCANNYKEYQFNESENGTSALLVFNDKVYKTRESTDWRPQVIFGEKHNEVYSGIVGRCSGGYIFLTASDSCLYVDNLVGSKPYMLFLEDVTLPELSADNVEHAEIVAYGSKGFVNEKDCPRIDVTEKIKLIFVLYQNEENYVRKGFIYTDRIGDIILQSKQDHGLFFILHVYKENADYYFELKGNYGSEYYVKCNEIFPDGIENLYHTEKRKLVSDWTTLPSGLATTLNKHNG